MKHAEKQISKESCGSSTHPQELSHSIIIFYVEVLNARRLVEEPAHPQRQQHVEVMVAQERCHDPLKVSVLIKLNFVLLPRV